ncbi:MAG: DUF4352 domain-containing protein [Haloferacaceae archaeon]
MRRRRYLAALGVGASGVLAGCSRSGGESTTARTGTETTTSTSGATTPSVSEAFEVTKRQGTETVRLNEVWVFGFSVRNVTDTTRTFRSTLSVKVDGTDEWQQLQGEVAFEVGPGETKTWRSPPFRYKFLRTDTYRLDALGLTWTVESLPLPLDYGLTYTSPVGLQVTVGQVTFRSEKPEGAENGTATATPTPTPPPPTAADASGTKWAVVPLTVANPTDQARTAPFPKEFTFRADGETYPDVPLDHPDLYHRDRALEPGEPLSGNLYYEIPAGTDANAIEIVLQRSYNQGNLDGDIKVIWSR